MFSDLTTDSVRSRVLREVEQLRAAYEAASTSGQRLTWLEREFWIDQNRRLILLADEAEELGAMDPAAIALVDASKLWSKGSRRALTTHRELVDLLAYLLVGPEHLRLWAPSAADFLRLAVVQPTVNPAFGPLFWLAMDVEMRPIGRYSNLALSVGEMAYDMSWFPGSRSEGPMIREAQIAFIQEVGYGQALGTTDWRAASDDAWASMCASVCELHEAGNLFWNVARTASDAIERTTRERTLEEVRARTPKDTFELGEGDRFACGSLSMRPPHDWRVELNTHDIVLPGAEEHRGQLQIYEVAERSPSQERLVEVASSLQTRFKSDAGEPVRAEVTELVLAGQPAAIARMSGRFTSPAAFGRDEIDWPDHMVINAVVRSPRGYWEIMLRGDRNFVEANEAKFMQMLETLAPR